MRDDETTILSAAPSSVRCFLEAAADEDTLTWSQDELAAIFGEIAKSEVTVNADILSWMESLCILVRYWSSAQSTHSVLAYLV